MRHLLALVAFGLTACAGSPSLPVRQIDHPFAMPRDTTSVRAGLGVSHVRDRSLPGTTFLLLPLEVLAPITDSWTWDLLLTLRYQFHHTEQSTLGVRFGLSSIGYASSVGWIVSPLAELYYKHKLAGSFALEGKLGGDYNAYSKVGAWDGWRGYLSLGGIIQLDENKSLTPRLIPSLERGFVPTVADTVRLFTARRATFALPLELEFHWRWDQQWSTSVLYGYRGIGYENGYRRHSGVVSLGHYW